MSFLKISKQAISKIVIFLILLIIFFIVIGTNAKEEVPHPIRSDLENVITEGNYSSYFAEHNQNYNNKEEYIITIDQVNYDDNNLVIDNNYEWIEKSSINFTVDVINEGLYLIYFVYQSISNSHLEIELSVKINNQLPYYEASQLTLDTLWTESSETVGVDRYGNDVSIMQEVYRKWQTLSLKDASRLYPEGLCFYLTDGVNKFEINKISGELLLKEIVIKPRPRYLTYQEYLQQHSKNDLSYINRFEAEEMHYKNSSTINRETSRDVGVLPFSKTKLKLNVIGINSFDKPGDSVTWLADIDKAGYYYLTFKVNQNRQNTSIYRTLYINGEIPFQEAQNLAFPYSKKWQNVTIQSLDYQPYLVYLKPGDEITLAVDSSLFINVTERIRIIFTEMTQLGLDVTKLTRNNIDKNIDWDMLEHFPNLDEQLKKWINDLDEVIQILRELSGFKKDSQVIQDIKAARGKILKIASNINELPRRLSLLSTGSSSAVQLLSAQIDNILYQPLTIDCFYIHTIDKNLPAANASFLKKAWIQMARFFLSFTDKSYSEKASPDEIEVWVNRSRQYVDLIQQITDDVFTSKYGIKVKVSIMSDDSKLLLANSANKQPDVALGVSAWIPNEYGMRGMLYDISNAKGFKEAIEVYQKEQLIPFIYDEQLFGLPETENFYVLLYRKDILDQLDLEIPNTWNDVIDMLPVLERYGMSFYVPLSNSSSMKSFDTTAPFIYQFGGKLYSDDAFRAGIDDEMTIKALSFMTDFYREYSMPYQVPSFFNSFRYGSIPIGIADFGTYLQLVNAASEIKGLWDIALVPGVERTRLNSSTNQEEKYIDRSMPGAQQAGIIFEKSKKKEESWIFLKWWMSTETQSLFANNLVNTLGSRYLWNSANIAAFNQFNWQESHKKIILKQWEYLKEVPKIPGSYIIEREISNTLNSVIFHDANLRSTISDAIIKTNKEINRKMKEFGYLDTKSNIIKEFKIPSIEIVERWLGE